MGKNVDTDRYKSFDVMLPQGARSKFSKAIAAVDKAEDALPDDALLGTAADMRTAIKHYQTAIENLTELMPYRKMLGID